MMNGDARSEWIEQQLRDFIQATAGRYHGSPEEEYFCYALEGSQDEVFALLPVITRIFDRYEPGWNTPPIVYDFENPLEEVWGKHRQLAQMVLTLVEREEEIERYLGENVPVLSARRLHPWAWGGASSLWESGHYSEAISAALRKVNAETQNKLGRRDVSETNLFKEAFSASVPREDKPRLRLMENDGSSTFGSVHRGAMAFAEGLFAGVRNPLAHESDTDLDEEVALEYLAAISVLARWVDEAVVVTA